MKPKLEVIKLDIQIPLYISEKVRQQYGYLCLEVPDEEWSGILFHDITGNTEDMSTVELYAQELILMDKGTKGYTEYDVEKDAEGRKSEWVRHLKSKVDGDMKKFTELLKKKDENRFSHIHSHNSMSVFFSGTDMDELCENSEHYNYYLSMIVNNNGDVCAKIAYRGKIKNILSYKDNNSKMVTKESGERDCIFTCECNVIHLFDQIDDAFENRLKQVLEDSKKKEEERKKTYEKWKKENPTYVPMNSSYNGNKFKGEDDNKFHSKFDDFEKELFPLYEGEEDDIKNSIPQDKLKSFIAKTIALDPKTTLGIEAVLNNIQVAFESSKMKENTYYDKIQEFAFKAYTEVFGHMGMDYSLMEAVCSKASDIIDTYEKQFPFCNAISHEFFTLSLNEEDDAIPYHNFKH